jgi:DNA-binding NarL/FixJ family response regulator
MVRVLVVDDHRMFAESLMRLLGDQDDIEVAGIAATVEEAASATREHHPDVVLLDYFLPDGDGAAACAAVHRASPDSKIVMMSASGDESLVGVALEAGCSSFVTKDRTAQELVDAVRTVSAGNTFFAASSLARLVSTTRVQDGAERTPLTAREREVVQLMVDGSSTADIAAHLGVSVNTVRNHTQSVLRKLGAHSRLEAAATAVRLGYARSPSVLGSDGSTTRTVVPTAGADSISIRPPIASTEP